MKTKVKNKLQVFNSNYEAMTGEKFNHFYCPFLRVDEEVELIEAHIVNKAFSNTHRGWTVQRKDIDGFYGGKFEDGFTKLEYKYSGLTPYDVLFDKSLEKKYNPNFFVREQKISHFHIKNDIPPEEITIATYKNENSQITLGLKTEVEKIEKNLEIEVSIDERVASAVSLLKAAYLTMFEMLKYNYALSPGGEFLGKLLGKFYKQNKDFEKKVVLENAKEYFKEYANLVKPLLNNPLDFEGTARDKRVFLVQDQNIVWAAIVFIKTADQLHSVIVPLYFDSMGFAHFQKLFKKEDLKLNLINATFKGNHWIAGQNSHTEWTFNGPYFD